VRKCESVSGMYARRAQHMKAAKAFALPSAMCKNFVKSSGLLLVPVGIRMPRTSFCPKEQT